MIPPPTTDAGAFARSRLKNPAVILLLLLGLWALLYLPHLRTSPGWYGDETLTHSCSLALANGHPFHYALWNTFWHPHYPYQPGYSLINGLFAKAAGGDIAGSRFFNALLALATALAIAHLGKKCLGKLPALFAAVLFLCYAQSVIHFRMSYAHNAVGFGVVLMTLFLLEAPYWKNDLLAGLGLGIAAGAHPLFGYAAIAALLVRIRHPKSWVFLFAPAALVVGVTMLLIYLRFGHWLIEDIVHLKNAFLSRGESDGSGWQSVLNFWNFALQDWFHAGAFLGLLLCLRRRIFPIAVVGLLVAFFLVRNRQNLIVFYYQAVIVLPTLALGWGGFVYCVREFVDKQSAPWLRVLVLAFWIFPLASLAQMAPAALTGTLTPRNAYWVTQSTQEVEEAAAWVNAHTTPTDSVGGNANIAWLLHARTVPYLQMITWYGLTTQGYDNGNKRERFRYDASLEAAKYAIVGDIDQRWTMGEPNVGKLFDKMAEQNWPVVWRGENYLILANPRYQKEN